MDTNIAPLVSIILPVYNAESFLQEAIESILNQTFQNFEVLVYDDCSTDKSAAIIKAFVDSRIKAVYSVKNLGYVYHLNEGLRMATGKYVARMDADDISDRQRIEKQVYFMETNPDIGICGSQISIIDDKGEILREEHYQIEDDKLRVRLLINSCFAHPTVIFRRDLFKENDLYYESSFVPAEDYKLWSKLATLTKLANLPDILLKYRNHPGQVTSRKRSQQQLAGGIVRTKLVELFFNRALSEEESYLHNSLCNGNFEMTKQYVTQARVWIESVLENGNSAKGYDLIFLREEMGKIWFTLCTHSYKLGIWTIFAFFSAKIYRRNVQAIDLMKFLLKSTVKFSPFERNIVNHTSQD